MDDIVNQLTIPELDKPHFLLYLNNIMLDYPLPAGYEPKAEYRDLFSKILRVVYKVVYNNAIVINPTAFNEIN
jgi:hypothetical protein